MIIVALATMWFAAAFSATAAGATPEAVRACVEGNLTRYTDPENALAAQYADIEAGCRAAIDSGSVSVQFIPDSGGVADGTESADSAPENRRGAVDETGAATTIGPQADSEASTDSSSSLNSSRTGESRSPVPSRRAVELVQAAATADASGGSPLPATATDLPLWLLVVLGAAASVAVGGIISEIRKHLR